jgi:ketosteroid isomerase-like protein
MSPEARFRVYIRAFNARDWDALHDFYAPGVSLSIGNGTQLAGRNAIINFYRETSRRTHRTIEVAQCLAGETSLAAEIESEFLAIEDTPDFAPRPLAEGDRYYVNS